MENKIMRMSNYCYFDYWKDDAKFFLKSPVKTDKYVHTYHFAWWLANCHEKWSLAPSNFFRFVKLQSVHARYQFSHLYARSCMTNLVRSSKTDYKNVYIDVWRGVWRCTHAKLAPLTPHPLAWDHHYGPASGQRGGTVYMYPPLCSGTMIHTVEIQLKW